MHLAPDFSFATALASERPQPSKPPGAGDIPSAAAKSGCASFSRWVWKPLQPNVTYYRLSPFFLHHQTKGTINLPWTNITACFGGDTQADRAHSGNYLAPHFILKCRDASQETMSKMKFIHCSAFANLVRVLISFAGLNIEIH